MDCTLLDTARHVGSIEREAHAAITTGHGQRDCAGQGNETRNNPIQIPSVSIDVELGREA